MHLNCACVEMCLLNSRLPGVGNIPTEVTLQVARDDSKIGIRIVLRQSIAEARDRGTGVRRKRNDAPRMVIMRTPAHHGPVLGSLRRGLVYGTAEVGVVVRDQGKQGRDSFPPRTSGVEGYGPHRLIDPPIVNQPADRHQRLQGTVVRRRGLP
jgi:hypothetical protein